jgi:hypothetical protein
MVPSSAAGARRVGVNGILSLAKTRSHGCSTGEGPLGTIDEGPSSASPGGLGSRDARPMIR